MSIITSPLLLGADSGIYQISRSLRFNSGDSAYLNRTPASASNRKTWTWSGWVKRSALGTYQYIWGNANSSAENGFMLRFNDTNAIQIADWTSTAVWQKITTQVFRDVAAWYHILVSYDTTNATAADRVRLYVNGTRVTDFSTSTDPTLSYDGYTNNTSLASLGRWGQQNAYYLDGYLADIYFIDGQALDPSSFTTTDLTTGQLIPKAYTGSYGTNGFKLNFSNNSTTAALGTDSSGAGNSWTVNNFSVTAGSGNDSLVDTPTSYGTDTGVGGEVRGNYCTWNPLISTSGPISNGNLEMVGANAWRNTKGTISVSTGKWYFEATYTGSQYGSALGNLAAGVGFCKSNTTTPNVDVNDSSLYGSILAFSQTGHVNNFNAPSSARSQIASGDVIGFALNYDAGTYTIYVNNTSTSSGSLNFTGELTPWTNAYYSGSYFILNTGQRAFAYTAPSGFKALCDTNLPTPVVAKPNTVMDVALWSGNGGSQTITLPGAFSPDFVWIKRRSSSFSSLLYDTVRGNGPNTGLISDSTTAEGGASDNATYGYLNAFNSTGFALTAGSSSDYVNTSGQTYVGWTWDAGSNTVTNNSGSVNAQVRANASTGFSVCTFAQPSSSSSFSWGHGLNVAPQLVIMKPRDSSGNWQVYHASTGAQYLWLNSTNAATGTGWSTVNSSIVTSTATLWQGSNVTTVAYCFSPVSGYSSMSSYVGTGSSDGPFVYTGFRPKFIMVKRSDASGEPWVIHDSTRDSYNGYSVELYPNYGNAEGGPYSPPIFDFLSNGFKIRSGGATAVNGSGGTFIYLAVAESPFQYARAR